jgi:hypothetical protein
MATLEQRLQIIIDAQNKSGAALSDVSKDLDKFKKNLESWKPAFKAMAVAGTAAFATISAIGVSALKEFADSEKQAIIANTALENAINGMTKKQLMDFTGGMDNASDALKFLQAEMKSAGEAAIKLGYDDDTARLSFAKLFQVTGDVTQSQKDLKLAMDLSAFSGRTLEESADALTKVYAGQTRVLKEFGIQVEEGTTALDALDMVNKRVQGSAEKAAKSLEGQTRILTERFNNLKEQIGASLAPAITKLLEKITPVIEKMTEWAEKNPELLGKIIMVSAAIAGLVAVLGTIGLVLPAVITGFQLMLGPFGLVVLAIDALIAAGVLLYKHWDEVKGFAVSIWNGIVDTISNAMLAIANFFKSIWDGIITAFQTYIYFIVGLFAMMMDLIWPNWQEGLQQIAAFWSQIWDGIKRYFIAVWGGIKIVFESMKGYFQTIWGAIVAVFNWAKDEIKKVFDWISSAIQPIFDLIDKLMSKLSAVGGAVSNAFGAVVAKGASILGARASGGPVSSGLPYLVGERGPEMFVPNTFGRIAGAGVGGITINITGNSFVGEEGIADRIGQSIMQAIRANVKL